MAARLGTIQNSQSNKLGHTVMLLKIASQCWLSYFPTRKLYVQLMLNVTKASEWNNIL